MTHAKTVSMTSFGRLLAIAAFVSVPLATPASAQSEGDWRYQVGVRSTFMVTAMPLSELGNGFTDLPAGGKSLPHSSSLFVMWPLGTHVRWGIETLVGNSYPESDTEMLFQAAGVTAEYQTAGTWFVALSAQTGATLVSATQSLDADTLGDPLRTGVHYKESGLFFAPQIGVGRRLVRYDVRLVGKQVWQFGADGQGAFDSFYAGISVALIRR
jgi:hypothetical protein